MALPVKMLIAAATMIAKDERAQRAAKSLWDKGVDAWGKRQDRQSASSAQSPTEAQAAWKAGGDRQQRFADDQSGDLIRFTYTDEDGLSCQRMVGNWRCGNGQLTGYCLNRKREESFAVARIGDWQELKVRSDG